jgi:hypothetical protein
MALAGGYLCRNAASYDHNTHAAFPGSLCVGRQVTVKSKICCKIAFRARLLLFSSLGGFLGAPPRFAWSSTRRTPPCRSPVSGTPDLVLLGQQCPNQPEGWRAMSHNGRPTTVERWLTKPGVWRDSRRVHARARYPPLRLPPPVEWV